MRAVEHPAADQVTLALLLPERPAQASNEELATLENLWNLVERLEEQQLASGEVAFKVEDGYVVGLNEVFVGFLVYGEEGEGVVAR